MAAADPEKLMIKADKLSVSLSLYSYTYMYIHHLCAYVSPCLDGHNYVRFFVSYLICFDYMVRLSIRVASTRQAIVFPNLWFIWLEIF